MHMTGSISKQFIAAAFVKLMLEEGSTLTMDQTVGDYLSEEDFDPEHTGEIMKKLSLDMTLASLLNHTSGMDDLLGTAFGLDLINCDKDEFLYDLVGLILNKRLPDYMYRDGWAPYKVLRDVITDYNPNRGYTYSSAGYIVLSMVIEKYLRQVHPGVSLSDYINENFILPYCDDRIILMASEFTDDSEYEILSDPNIFQDELDYLISRYTDINPRIMQVLGINREEEPIFNLRDFMDSYNSALAKGIWTGGGIAANSHQVARFGYNFFGLDVADPTNSEVRALVTEGIGSDDYVDDRTYCFFRMNLKENDEDPDMFLYGHNGKTLSVSNVMMYDPEADICFSIFVDSNAPESNFYNLMREIHYMYL